MVEKNYGSVYVIGLIADIFNSIEEISDPNKFIIAGKGKHLLVNENRFRSLREKYLKEVVKGEING